MTMQFQFLNSQSLISAHWPAVERLLSPVVAEAARGEFTMADIENLCRDGSALCAVVFDPHPVLAVVLEWKAYPRRTVMNVVALGGRDLARIGQSFWPTLRTFARESGAAEIEACASPAMTRMLREFGMVHTYNVVRCSTGEPACH